MALRLCPQAKVMKDMELYSKLSHDITQVIIEEKAIVEKQASMNFI
jgi:DNA polymerase-4